MKRVFHIPSHLSYVSKLTGPEFAPVPSPSGGPLTVSALLALDSWDFFDVLHLHTVELATIAELAELVERLPVVFTMHDLMPNIESDPVAFDEKTRLMVERAARVMTLTELAASMIETRFGRRPVVVPHGYAVPPVFEPVRREPGYFAFGALRPNRRLVQMARAWSRLPADRLPLSIVLRSVGPADRDRYASDLDELVSTVPGIEVVDRVLTSEELTNRCSQASVLVMPYSTITHSGQLELARDVGLGAVLPDVPTLRSQLGDADHPCVWFPTAALDDPDMFSEYLADAAELPRPGGVPERTEEHAELLRALSVEYRSASWNRPQTARPREYR